MLECVVNISEGRDRALLTSLASNAGESLLDVHSDAYHNRSVFTLAGLSVVDDAIELTAAAVATLDLQRHGGAHPRLGIVDVVPFVPLGIAGLKDPPDLDEALSARDRFARIAGARFELPCFLYGPERSLPMIRRAAFIELAPDFGPSQPNPRTGACCVGARGALIAYNVNVDGLDLTTTRSIARHIRRPGVRALGFDLDGNMQISCNLTEPIRFGIAAAYDLIEFEVQKHNGTVRNAELVGLVPSAVFDATPPARRELLGLGPSATIESRIVGHQRWPECNE